MTTTSPQEPMISVRGVSKWFGNLVAVNEVSLDIGPGVTGLLGPNGAGKTTLLHMIAGLSAVSRGEILIMGQPVRGSVALYQSIGVMTEHQSVYDQLTGRQFVALNAKLQKVSNVDEAVEKAISTVNLLDAQDRKLATYSRGMRQRMRLAATLVHDPPILVLDEPLNGTDPRQRLEFQDMAHRLAAEGRAVVVSSHILEEVEELADTILLMVAGRLAASGNFDAIRAKLDERPYEIRVRASDSRHLAGALFADESVDSVKVEPDDAVMITTRDIVALQSLLPRAAKDSGVTLFSVEPTDESLESVFSYVVAR